MYAIFKREFLSYFRSAVGYVSIAIFSFLSGFIFYTMFSTGMVNISTAVIELRSFFVIIVPILTMGRLAVVMFVNVIIHIIVTLCCGGKFNVGAVGTIIVFFFMAFMYITIGLFASAITDSQIISAIVSFIIILVTQIISEIAKYSGTAVSSLLSTLGVSTENAASAGRVIRNGISWLDPFAKTEDFELGIFSVSALVFLFSIGILFIYLTYRVLEKKRWSQA